MCHVVAAIEPDPFLVHLVQITIAKAVVPSVMSLVMLLRLVHGRQRAGHFAAAVVAMEAQIGT